MANQVKPVPEGQGTITPHLVVRGAAEAIEFYKKAFGAIELFRMPWTSPDGSVKVGHAELQIGDSKLFLADESHECGSLGPATIGGSPVVIALYVEDTDATFARAIEAGATSQMPPENMFWGDRYGKLTDPYGHQWSICTHIEDVPHEEMEDRMKAAMAEMAGAH